MYVSKTWDSTVQRLKNVSKKAAEVYDRNKAEKEEEPIQEQQEKSWRLEEEPEKERERHWRTREMLLRVRRNLSEREKKRDCVEDSESDGGAMMTRTKIMTRRTNPVEVKIHGFVTNFKFARPTQRTHTRGQQS